MAQNIADGVYNAIPTVAAVYEKNNTLKLEIHFTLCDEDGTAYMRTGSDGNEYPVEKYKYYTLVNAQGAVNTKVVEGIAAWAKSWDQTDPYWWTEAANVASIGMVEVTLKTAPSYSDPSKSYQNVEWVNELGHSSRFGGGAKAIQSGDRATIMAKYGAKFKAAFGAKPKPVGGTVPQKTLQAAPVANAPAAAPVRKPGPGGKVGHAPGVALDRFGVEIPMEIKGAFAYETTRDVIESHLRHAVNLLKNAMDEKDPSVAQFRQADLIDLQNLLRAARFTRPYCVCRICQGNGRGSCSACHETGFQTEEQYKRNPKEFLA